MIDLSISLSKNDHLFQKMIKIINEPFSQSINKSIAPLIIKPDSQ